MIKKYLIFVISFLVLTGCSLPADISKDEPTNSLSQGIEQTTAGNELNSETTQSISSKAEETHVGNILLNLYYQDKEGYLIPVTRRVEKQVAPAKLAISGLIDSSLNREEMEYFGLYPVLPMGTEVLGINIKDGNAVIDFNEKLLDYDNENAERNIVASVVYTLTEFSTIKKVKILVEGRTIKQLEYKTDLSDYLSRDNVLINSDTVNLNQEYKKVDIYLFRSFNNKFSYIIPISKQFSDMETDGLLKKIVSFITNERIPDGFYSQLPKDVKLIGSEINGNVLNLNFSKEIMAIGGNTREDGLVKQILYTAKQLKGITKVKISVDGTSQYLPEGTDISQEIIIPQVINDFIDRE